MITLQQNNSVFVISIHDLTIFNAKENILDAYGFAGLKVAKNSSKEMLATSWK